LTIWKENQGDSTCLHLLKVLRNVNGQFTPRLVIS
jgi:hypothetical protein